MIRIEDLKVYFHPRKGLFRTETVKAVDGVTLEIPRGSSLALVGESGSGKTTLGRATLGLLEPTAGRVVFDGQALSAMGPEERKAFRRRAQAIFQDPFSSINPFMQVLELVEEPLIIHGVADRRERRRRALEALEQVKLTPAEEIAEKYPHSLSGGQRQRVGIARAIVLRPDYIVADEPVSMIDASNRAEILYLLRELQERHGLTFLYITHDIAGARHFADRIAVMYLGTVVEHGSAEQVVENPLHPYTQGLLASVPEPDPANRFRMRPVIPGETPSATETPAGCPFVTRCGQVIEGRCAASRPGLEEREKGHWAACWLHEAAVGEKQVR